MFQRTIAFSLVLTLFIAMVLSVQAGNPVISDISPEDNSTGLELDDGKIYLKANICDPDGDLSLIKFETNKSGGWATIKEMSVSENWTTDSAITFSNLNYNTKYWWRIKAKDENNNWTTSSPFSFTTEQEPEQEDGEIQIITSVPTAGKNIIVLIDKNEASGYMITEQGNVYIVEIKNRIGMINLGMDYGEAELYIVGYGDTTFEIASPFEGDLTIDAPSELQINEEEQFSILAGGEMISAKLKMISPTGDEKTKMTRETEPVTISFDEPGNWTLIAEIYDTVTTTEIMILPEPLEIDLPSQNNMIVGNEMEIDLNTKATVTITKDETSWTYKSDDDGKIYFTPLFPGRHKITANSYGQSGSKYFSVKAETKIMITDETGQQTNQLNEGDVVLIQIKDTEGSHVDAEELNVFADGNLLRTLVMNSGTAIWRVSKQAQQFTFDFIPSDNEYLSSSLVLTGTQGTLDMNYVYIAIVIIIFILVMYIFDKMGWIDLSSLKNILKKEEEEESLL